jgi:isochorismate hydrolase
MKSLRKFLGLLLTAACALTFHAAVYPQQHPQQHPQENSHEVKNMGSSSAKESALVIVDAQVGILASTWDSKRVVGNIGKLISKARSAGVPIFWVQHSDAELKLGSDAWKLMPDFTVQPTDPVIHKTFNSSFADTDLETQLKGRGVKRVVLAGALTNWCMRATAYSAIERGYNLSVASDAHSTENMESSPGRVIAAKDIVDEFNSVMRWLAVPKIQIEVKSAEELAF